jgi:hypothetical protein
MRLSELTINEIGRLLNGKGHPHEAAVAHLAMAAARCAESLTYLADIDNSRFDETWPIDSWPNDMVDEAHVRWAATSALTSLDLCMAAAARLGGFINREHREVSIRDFYRIENSGKVVDRRDRVLPPWRAWLDGVISDNRYDMLLKVRHALVHSDALREVHLSFEPLSGHELRYGYHIGPLTPPATSNSHKKIMGRQVVEMSRDIAQAHVATFIKVLQGLP